MSNQKTVLINLSQIHDHTQNPKINYEIGGYFIKSLETNTLRFYHTDSGKPPRNSTNRIHIGLRKKGKIWHTHPHNTGFWPSFEDINRDNPYHILFTKYGIWVFGNNPVKNNRNAVNSMRNDYITFHKYMETTTQMIGGWDPREVEMKIHEFTEIMRTRYGFNITFLPNWSLIVPTNKMNKIKRNYIL